MNNEELMAKIAGHVCSTIKEAEESGVEVNRKVDPEVSKEIVNFLLKTPETFKRIQHDTSFAARSRISEMWLHKPSVRVQPDDVKLEWLADGANWDYGPFVYYMEDPDPDYTLPEAWFRVIVEALGNYIACHEDDFRDDDSYEVVEEPEQGDK